jgi:hypothetical protein
MQVIPERLSAATLVRRQDMQDIEVHAITVAHCAELARRS